MSNVDRKALDTSRRFASNRLRLLFAALAYALMINLRRLALSKARS